MVALTVSTPSARCARVVPHRDTAPSTSSRRRVGGRGRWEESPSRGVSIRRRGAVVVRASGDDAGGSQATTSAWEDDASASSSFGAGDAYVPPAPPRRETPLERAVKDPLAAAIMAPRVALGGLDLLSKGELFAVAAEEAGELSALLSDPRPIQDKAAEAFRRAETVVEMFEARGVVAEAPGRELVRPAIPADLYDKYLDPAAIEPAPATPSASANAYTAEPASYASAATTTREVEIPESEAFTAASTAASASVTYAFDDAEDAAVAAAAAAVAAALGDEDEDEDASGAVDSQSELVSASGADAVEEVEAPAAARASTSDASASPAFDAPAPPADAWSAAKETESLAAEFVMGQSAAIATKEAR